MAGLGCGIPEGSMGWEMCIVLLQASHIPVSVPGWKGIRMEEMWTQRVQSAKGLEGIFLAEDAEAKLTTSLWAQIVGNETFHNFSRPGKR